MFFAVLFRAPPPPRPSVFYTVFLCFFDGKKHTVFAVLFLSLTVLLCFTCRSIYILRNMHIYGCVCVYTAVYTLCIPPKAVYTAYNVYTRGRLVYMPCRRPTRTLFHPVLSRLAPSSSSPPRGATRSRDCWRAHPAPTSDHLEMSDRAPNRGRRRVPSTERRRAPVRQWPLCSRTKRRASRARAPKNPDWGLASAGAGPLD